MGNRRGSAGQMMNCSGLRYPVDRIAFAQRQIQISFFIEHHRPRSVERGAFDGCPVWRRLCDAGAGVGLDHAG